MIQFFRRLVGLTCCIEFTQWEDHKAEFSRPITRDDNIPYTSHMETIEYTKRWQERRCTICGKIQQRRLKW